MRTSLICLVASVTVLLLSSGCATLQLDGWDTTSASTVDEISNVLRAIVLNSDMNDPEGLRVCIIQSGIAGGLKFWESRKYEDNMSKRVLIGVKAADKYAKINYTIAWEKYNGLDGIVLEVILAYLQESGKPIVEINEAEALIALLNVFANTGAIGNLVDIENLEI